MKNKFRGDKVILSSGVTIEDHHQQDCCECVYADWSALENTPFEDYDFNSNELKIERVEGSGFRINGFFVPCYNEQNGYYSSELSLIITKPVRGITIMDISECVEDRID